jgi:hypothetical protein
VAAVKSTATGRPDYQAAVAYSLAQGAETSRLFQDITGVDSHRSGPEALSSPATDYGYFFDAHVFHGSGDRADIAGAPRLHENDADVF